MINGRIRRDKARKKQKFVYEISIHRDFIECGSRKTRGILSGFFQDSLLIAIVLDSPFRDSSEILLFDGVGNWSIICVNNHQKENIKSINTNPVHPFPVTILCSKCSWKPLQQSSFIKISINWKINPQNPQKSVQNRKKTSIIHFVSIKSDL